MNERPEPPLDERVNDSYLRNGLRRTGYALLAGALATMSALGVYQHLQKRPAPQVAAVIIELTNGGRLCLRDTDGDGKLETMLYAHDFKRGYSPEDWRAFKGTILVLYNESTESLNAALKNRRFRPNEEDSFPLFLVLPSEEPLQE